MKLTTQQIETIEYYILSWEIKNKDFYEEILDHFISAVENRMVKENETFDYAFPEISEDFAYHEFKPAFFSETFYGLKAMELEFQKRTSHKAIKILFRDSIKHLKSSFAFLWVFIAFSLYQTTLFFSLKMALLFCAIVNVSLWLLSPITFIGFKRAVKILRIKLFRFEESLSLEERKQKQLIPVEESSFVVVFVLICSFLNIINFINFFDLEIPKNVIQLGTLSYLFLLLPFSWSFFKLIFERE